MELNRSHDAHKLERKKAFPSLYYRASLTAGSTGLQWPAGCWSRSVFRPTPFIRKAEGKLKPSGDLGPFVDHLNKHCRLVIFVATDPLALDGLTERGAVKHIARKRSLIPADEELSVYH